MYLELGPFMIVQLRLQNLFSYLTLGFEGFEVCVLSSLIGFELALVRVLVLVLGLGLPVNLRRPHLPLSPKHHRVPEFQPLQQTAVGKLHMNTATYQINDKTNKFKFQPVQTCFTFQFKF